MLPFNLPPPQPDTPAPIWSGNGFSVGETTVPVLEYSENFSGWSDDLTSLHEDAIGSTHPIDRASRSDAVCQLETYLHDIARPTILEIGCSSGFLLKDIGDRLRHAIVIGADVVREPLYRLAAVMPSIPLLRFDLLKCPMPDNSLDAVVMLNVLEHIEDDVTAIAQMLRIIKPGGIVVIEVPAGPHLYDGYDKCLMHFRRYDSANLCRKLSDAGFSVIRRSHLGFFLYPAFVWTKRRNQRALSMTDGLQQFVTKSAVKTSSSVLFRLIVAMERMVGRWINFPIGVRCLVVARKPANA